MLSAPSNFDISEDEAALKLGVTKELLFAYTRNSPKRDKRKLNVIRDGQNWKFSSKDLEEWDEYLRKPWSTRAEKRPKIPKYIEEYLKVECGGCCALCGKGHALENAHIVDYSISLSHHHHNIIRICTECHKGDTYKNIPKQNLKKIKDRLIQKVRESLQKDEHYYSGKNVHRIPQVNSLFVGRKKELNDIRKRILGDRAIIIDGIGGLGKTEFLIKALESITDLPLIWFDVENYRNFNDLLLALRLLLIKHGIKLEESIFDSLNKQRIRLVFDGLDQIPREEWDHVLNFLENFIRLTIEPKIIVTTNIEITELTSKIYRLSLPPLNKTESTQLIKLGYKDHNEIKVSRDDISWLVSFCDGLAGALRQVIAQLRYYKNSYIVIEQLRKFGAMELKSQTRTQQRKTNYSICLESSYSNFTHNQKRLLQYISNFPAGCPQLHVQNFQKENDYYKDIAELKRFFFIEIDADPWEFEYFHLLNPIRSFIRQNWKSNAYEEAALIQLKAAESIMVELIFMSQSINSKDIEDVKNGLFRINYYFSNYFHILKFADWCANKNLSKSKKQRKYLEIIYGIGSSLSRYFFMSGLFNYGISVTELVIESLLKLGETTQVIEEYRFLASYQYRIHDVEGAEETANKLINFAKSLSDPEITAQISWVLGDLADKSGNSPEAIKHYESAAEYYRTKLDEQLSNKLNQKLAEKESVDFYMSRLGMILEAIGTAYRKNRQFGDALPYLIKSVEYVEKSGDHPNIGVVNHQLGICYSLLGNKEDAVSVFIKALDSFIQLDYAEYISNSMEELGELFSDSNFNSGFYDYFTEDIVSRGLEDVEYSIKLLFGANSPPSGKYRETLRKLFNVIKLVSYTSSVNILMPWAEKFAIEFLKSIYKVNENTHTHNQHYFFNYFALITDLGYSVGEIALTEKMYKKEEIAHICCVCSRFSEVELEFFEPFEWIASLLRYWKVYSNIKAGHLQGAIEAAHYLCDDHSKFNIDL